jgi:hypothetical protein
VECHENVEGRKMLIMSRRDKKGFN